MLTARGLNSFQGLLGQLSVELGLGLVPMLSLDSSEDSLTCVGGLGFTVGWILRGDQPGGRLNLATRLTNVA